ncbi:conserved hypothetical protein [Rubrivivax sp. A210]|uniref:hypothetical protein n=1 Tax=Rubrivivax sp. A210 TaxID=2772301 RepID=UPI00191A749B|nr:hypothetical protein [Rubrivivax sp. A210]CAD5366883.1 conserved hypothetical protein [Rubrivivax sp. A210]
MNFAAAELNAAAAMTRPPTLGSFGCVPRTARVLLVGTPAFAWLRLLQERAPGPRVDLRYLIEGAILLLQARSDLHTDWIGHSREALVRHVAGRQAIAPARTGRAPGPAEGAQARTSGASPSHRHDDCKALQIGEAAFQWLKGKQGTTRDPRLDLRYLVEGALTLIGERAELLPQVVGLARRSLRDHLAELEHQSVEPFSLEKSQ